MSQKKRTTVFVHNFNKFNHIVVIFAVMLDLETMSYLGTSKAGLEDSRDRLQRSWS